MVGTGIFFFVSPVAQHLHSGSAILAAWVVGTLIAGCGALCLAELAAAYPKSGGVYVYMREAFGPFVAFLYLWAYFLIIRVGNLAILALAVVLFLSDFLGISHAAVESVQRPLAFGVVAAVTALNAYGVRAAGNTQIVLTMLKLLSLVAIMAVALLFAAGALTPHPIALEAAPPIASESSSVAFFAALIPIMWTLGGWDEATYAAEEIRDPERNLPIAVLGGLLSVASLYVLVNASYLAVLSTDEVAASGTQTALLAMRRALGEAAPTLLSLALMISALGSANAVTLSGARIAYASGRDNAMLRWATKLHPRTNTPVRSLIAQAAFTCLAIAAFSDPYALLLYTAVAYWMFSALLGVAVIVLRLRDPQRPRPFHAPAYPWVAIVFGAAGTAMAIAAAVESPADAAMTFALLLAGTVAFWIQRALAGGEHR
jgi:APA family basic amino acid/polyamine antiporter